METNLEHKMLQFALNCVEADIKCDQKALTTEERWPPFVYRGTMAR